MSGWRDRAAGLLKRAARAKEPARSGKPVPVAEPGIARVAVNPEA